jgi:hypothetical protein
MSGAGTTRWGRRLRRVATGLGLVLLGGLLVLLVLLYSGLGRNLVRLRLESALSEALGVPVHIGALRLGLTGEVEAHELVIREAAGAAAPVLVAVRRTALDVDLWALLRGRLRVQSLLLDRPEFHLQRRGPGWNVDVLRSAEEEQEEPRTAVRLDALEVRGGIFSAPLGDRVATLERVQLAADVDVAATSARVRVATLRADWRELGAPIALRGELLQRGDELVARALSLALGPQTLSQVEATWDLAQGGIEGRGRLALQAAAGRAALARLGITGAAGWTGDLDLMLELRRARAAAPLQLAVAGSAAGAPVSLEGEIEPEVPRLRLSLAAERLSLPALWAGTPDSALSTKLRIQASGSDLATLHGQLDLELGGELAGVPVRRGTGRIAYAGQRVEAELEVETPRGAATVSLVARRAGLVSAHIDEARVSARIPELATVAGGRVGGVAERIELRARGPLEALEVSADLLLRQLRHGDSSAGTVVVTARARGLSPALDVGQLAGQVELRAEDLAHAGERVDSLAAQARVTGGGRRTWFTVDARRSADKVGAVPVERVQGRGRLDREGSEMRLSLAQLAVALCGQTVSARGGTLSRTAAGRLRVRKLALAAPLGALELDGALDLLQGGSAGTLALRLRELDLAAVSRCLSLAPELSGRATLALTLRRQGGALGAAFELLGSALRRGGVGPAADLRLSGSSGGGNTEIALDLSSPDVRGNAHLEAAVAGPRDLLDLAFWRGLHPSQLARLKLQLRELDLAQLATALGEPLPVLTAGALSVDAALAGPGAPLTGRVELGGARAATIERLAAAVDLRWTADRLGATIGLRHDDATVLSGDLALRWPRFTMLDGAGLLALPVSGALRIDRLELARLHEATLLPVRVSGQVTAGLSVSGTAGRPEIAVQGGVVNNLDTGQIQFKRIRLAGRGSRDGGELTASVEQRRRGSLQLSGRYRHLARTLHLALDARRFELDFLKALVDDPRGLLEEAHATLDGKLVLDGPLARQQVSGQLIVRGERLLLPAGPERIDSFQLTLTPRGEQIGLALQATSVKGRVDVTAQLRGLPPAPASLEARITSRGLPLLAGEYRAGVDLDGTLRATLRGQDLVGRLSIARGKVALSRSSRDLQPLGGLDDVVYVDERARRQARRKQEKDRRRSNSGGGNVQLVIDTEDSILLTAEQGDVRLRPRLTLRLAGSGLSLTGDIGTLRGSTASIFDRRYDVVTGQISFSGSPTNPELHLRLSREFPVATVYIQVDGTATQPKVQLATDVGTYDEAQILAIMLGEDPRQAENSPVADAATAAPRYVVGSLVKERLPVKLSVLIPHTDGFEVGRWISNAILVSYRYRWTPTLRQNTNEVGVDWHLGPNLMLEGRFGERQVGNLDILRIWRF